MATIMKRFCPEYRPYLSRKSTVYEYEIWYGQYYQVCDNWYVSFNQQMCKPLGNKKSQKLSYGNCDFERSFFFVLHHQVYLDLQLCSVFMYWCLWHINKIFSPVVVLNIHFHYFPYLYVEHGSLCYRFIIDNISTLDNKASK